MNPITQPSQNRLLRILQAVLVTASFYLLSWVCRHSFINVAHDISQYALLSLAYYASFKWFTATQQPDGPKPPSEYAWFVVMWAAALFIPAGVFIDLYVMDLQTFNQLGGWFPFVVLYFMGCYAIGKRAQASVETITEHDPKPSL